MPHDAVTRVESHERDAGDSQHWLDVLADVPPVLSQESAIVAETERRKPPGHVVIAGDHDYPAGTLRVPDEGTRALELARPGALRQVAGDGDDPVAPLLDERLDRFVLFRNGRMPEMQVGTVKEVDRRHRRAMI